MISVKDRVSLYPGRTKQVPVPGQTDTFDVTRADQPQEAGTPLNRKTSQLLQADIRSYPVKSGESIAARDVVNVVGGVVTNQPATIGSFAIGSTIWLNVGGRPTEFIVVHRGRPSSLYSTTFTGKTILLMKDLYIEKAWHTSRVNDYANSSINSYLNSTFYNLLDSSVRSQVSQVKIPYRAGSGASTTVTSGESGLAAKVWLPSVYELGFTSADDNYIPADGAKFSYFLSGSAYSADQKRISTFENTAFGWFLRSPRCDPNADHIDRTGLTSGCGHDGSMWGMYVDSDYGIRPALAFPDTFTGYLSDTPPCQAIALKSGTSGQSIDVIFDGVVEFPGITAGTRIASPGVVGYSPQAGWLWAKPEWDVLKTGSYIGTGTFGYGSPNTLTVGGDAKAVLILADYAGLVLIKGAKASFNIVGGAPLVVNWVGEKVRWYVPSGSDPSQQLNYSGRTYTYVVI